MSEPEGNPMRFGINMTLSLLLLSLMNGQAGQLLKIKVQDVYIYSEEEGGIKKALLSEGEEVALLKKGMNRSKIKASGGTVGWVLNSQTEYTVLEKGMTFELNTMSIQGWLDNPTAIYILDHSAAELDGMLLTRTWTHDIFEFLDREHLERHNQEN